MKQAGKQASGFPPSDRYFSFFWVVISMIYVVLFILGKYLLASYQLFLIFTEIWLYNFCVSRLRLSDGMFLSPVNFCSVLWRPVSLFFSLLSVLEDYGS